jgi:hypothetical protein
MRHKTLTSTIIGGLAVVMITLPLLGMYSATHAQSSTCAMPSGDKWRGCEPKISTENVVSTTAYSAIVKASYSSSGADYNSEYSPSFAVEYGKIIPGQVSDFDKVAKPSSGSEYMAKGNRTLDFVLPNLEEGEKYAYRARLEWIGDTKYGEPKFFYARKAITPTEPKTTTTTTTTTSSQIPANTTSGTMTNTGSTSGSTSGTSSGTTNTKPTTSTTVYSTKPTITPLGSLFGTDSSNSSNTDSSGTNNVMEKSGFRLAIDNGETRVSHGDTVTIKVRYENNNTKSYDNAVVDIYLAPQYTFTSTNKGIHDRIDNKVTISLREFPGGGFGTAVISAKATGKPGELDQAVSQAALRVNKTTLKVSDIDEYSAESGSSNVLGASASGTSFLPGSIVGWLILLIIIAAIIILGRRYFMKKDY